MQYIWFSLRGCSDTLEHLILDCPHFESCRSEWRVSLYKVTIINLYGKLSIGIVLNEKDPVKMRAIALILVCILIVNFERMKAMTICNCP